ISVVIFRIGREWFALKSQFFKEITHILPIRAIPNRSNQILLGLVNIRGELNLCISLKELLGLQMSEKEDNFQQNEIIYQRMVVLEKEGNNWVFSVDQIYGVYRFSPDELEKVPDSLSKSGNNYTKGMIKWSDQNVNYLDDELLFYTLDHKVL
ncbi:MAG TPA: chemotaxis protein CheW, partial [Allocoleopsis sp.]